MDTIELTLSIPPPEHDRFIGWLENYATGFVQEDTALRAYIPADRWAAVDRERLDAQLAADGYSGALTARPLAAKNWNAVWEDTLSPAWAGPFVVCPTSVDAPQVPTDGTVLHIDPQMSFGTGHHATTRLALQLLADGDVSGTHMLDVGTGTGILAIAACRTGATSAFAVDTDPDAVRNARENVVENNVANCVTVRKGSIDAVPETCFGLVAANITRRVLLNLLPSLVSHLAAAGTLVLSGVLEPDRDAVFDAVLEHGMHPDAEQTEEGWWAARFSFSA